uniref:NAD(+) diphosphatase n=1 Tax=Alexandrium andersonii TaxID=327968 RepID=A0A7S2D7T3_9DINO
MKLLMLGGCEAGDFTVVGHAFSKIVWHKTVQFCGKCGQPTESCDSGTKRQCTACKARFYPRIDPSCMVLVRKPSDDACLLVRNKGWPPGMWSCLSGYVEQGEQVEEAIKREVMEETQIQVDLQRGVDWLGTQPWPLGPGGKAELMLAAEVVACSEEVEFSKAELEDARWFSRSEVVAMLQIPPDPKAFVPGENSAAHHLLRRWSRRGEQPAPE